MSPHHVPHSKFQLNSIAIIRLVGGWFGVISWCCTIKWYGDALASESRIICRRPKQTNKQTNIFGFQNLFIYQCFLNGFIRRPVR